MLALCMTAWLEDTATIAESKKGRKRVVTEYKLKDFLNSRKQPEVHKLFLEKFVIHIVSKRLFKNRLERRLHNINELCTVSDETFCLLVLENAWDNWVDTHLLHGGKWQREPRPRKDNKRQRKKDKQPEPASDESDKDSDDASSKKEEKESEGLKSTVPKSSVGFKHTSQANQEKGYFQWDDDALTRFDELYDMVKENRQKYVDVDRMWLNQQAESDNNDKAKRRRTEKRIVKQDW